MRKSWSQTFLFSFCDLVVKVEYFEEENNFEYAFNKKVSFAERVLVEQYLLVNVVPKTSFYASTPSSFVYIGVSKKLAQNYKLLKFKEELIILKDCDLAVQELISNLRSQYYFEQIGDLVVKLRKKLADQNIKQKNTIDIHDVICIFKKINFLLLGYNKYSQKTVTLDDVIPENLQKKFKL